MTLVHLHLRRGEAIAEHLDRQRRQTWEQRLEEAEAFEAAVNLAARGAA